MANNSMNNNITKGPLSSSSLFNSENLIGQLRGVSPSVLEFVASCPCNVGDYVLVEAGDIAVFGPIANMQQEARKSESSTLVKKPVTVGIINPSASIETTSGRILTGLARTPALNANVYKIDSEVVRIVLNPILNQEQSSSAIKLKFASFIDSHAGDVAVTPEMIFGRHLAVLGTTGSGKSWTLASIVEHCKQFQCKIILLDPSGEYSAQTQGVHSVYLGSGDKIKENALEVVLPYYELRENDLFAIFNPSGETQGPKLRSAIKSLKLARIEPDIAVDGLVFKANKVKQAYESAYKKHYLRVEQPDADFDINLLTRQINNECVFPVRSDLEPFTWGDYNSIEQAHVINMVNRIQQIISSKELQCIFNPGSKTSLLAEIDAFFRTPHAKVLRISLKYLSFSFNTREIIANAIGRFLLEKARASQFENQPLIVMLDEGHHFLNEKLISGSMDFPLDAFSLIAKEGRKYGLTICVATQRPRDIPEGVLSQMGAFIVHRIINDRDTSVIESAASQANRNTISILPMLSPGEALIMGSDFKAPLHVKIKPPKGKPNSSGPDYQRYWF